MITHQLIEQLKRIARHLDSSNITLEFIHQVAALYPAIADLSAKLAEGGLSQGQVLERYNELIDSLRRALTSLISSAPGTRYITLDSWLKDLLQTQSDLEEHQPVQGLTHVIHRATSFYQRFDEFVHTRNSRETYYLILAAHDLESELETIRPVVMSIIQLLDESETISGSSAQEFLSILFFAQNSLTDVATKSTALNAIYEELCRLLAISSKEYPVKLIKLECGSLWYKLFGEPRVIKLMGDFIEGSLAYVYRNFTIEGKMQAIPKNADTIDSLLQLSRKLKENGIDNQVLNDNLQHSAIVLAQQFDALLSGEPKVDVNGETYSLEKEREERFLQENRMLFLGTGSNAPDNDTDEEAPNGNIPPTSSSN